jgi:hypoxanthine-DNA glycosylase
MFGEENALEMNKSCSLIHLNHPFDPIFDEKSAILILGTFPSVKSREYGFYYAHPQNRFWKVIAGITNTSPIPEEISTKKQMLLRNKIALADVIQSCSIEGSSDNTIREELPANLLEILSNSDIKCICANGGKAHQLFMRYFAKNVHLNVEKLPSTSPANASYSLEKLILEWKRVISTFINLN